MSADIERQTIVGMPVVVNPDMPPGPDLVVESWGDHAIRRGMPDNFGERWAANKLDLPRRRRELEAFIQRWIPEVATMPSGLFLDVGCGCGDLLAMIRDMGHDVLGIDAPHGEGGMGDFYLQRCREISNELEVPIAYTTLFDFLLDPNPNPHTLQRFSHKALRQRGKWSGILMRGSIEQTSSHVMVGIPHSAHHDCRQLNWDRSQSDNITLDCRGVRTVFHTASLAWLWRVMDAFESLLGSGGVLLISANGTRDTDEFYDVAVRKMAADVGLQLVDSSGHLNHKWIKHDRHQ